MTRSRTIGLIGALLIAGCGSTVQSTTGMGTGMDTGAQAGLLPPGSMATPDPSNSAASGGGATPGATRLTSGSVAGPGTPSAARGLVSGRDTRPLQLGVYGVSNPQNAAKAFGVDSGTSFSITDVYKALIAAFNTHGGVAGRPIVPIYSELNAEATSYDTDAQAACQNFTQDHHVAVVVSVIGSVLSEAFESCLAKAGLAHLSVGPGGMDRVGYRRYPGWYNVAGPTVDDRLTAQVQGALGDGYLTQGSKLGLVVEECPYNGRAVSQTLRPLLRRRGLSVAVTATITCIAGIGDIGGGWSAAMQNAVLRFRTAGVDRVMYVSNAESVLHLLFSTSAEAQQYRPGYLLSSAAAVGAESSSFSPAQLPQMRGTGWVPSWDITSGRLPSSPVQQRCLEYARSGGITPRGSADWAYIYNTCDSLLLLEASLLAGQGKTDLDSVRNSVASLDRRPRFATNLGGLGTFKDGRQGGVVVTRSFAYRPSCSCFQYVGRERPL